MRHLMKALIMVLAVVFTAGLTAAEVLKYEGELNPNEFSEWEVIGRRQTSHYESEEAIVNPDENSNIQIVQVFFFRTTITKYRYFKGIDIYDYRLNNATKTYERYIYTEEERQGCVKCHKDRLGTRI